MKTLTLLQAVHTEDVTDHGKATARAAAGRPTTCLRFKPTHRRLVVVKPNWLVD